MKILLLGSGGREHALAWKMAQSSILDELYIAPGNSGTRKHGKNIAIDPNDFEAVKAAVIENNIDIVIVGPEKPLVNGISDFFMNDDVLAEIPVIGPDSKGAQLEGSKDFAKTFMKKYNIPTAKHGTFTKETLEKGISFLQSMNAPYVLKADGLAAGKGVLILNDLKQAEKELKNMLMNSKFGSASEKVVIEQFLDGREVSVFIITDGQSFKLLPEAKDYKRIGEQDTGPNTGGMGAVSPVPFADAGFMDKVHNQIIVPTTKGLKSEGINYKGFIFFGLINVKGDPYVIEYNCRLGDPETEVVLPRLKSDILDLFEGIATNTLSERDIQFYDKSAATVMLVSGGYPDKYEKGKQIFGLNTIVDSLCFHAGTKSDGPSSVTSGGRVMAITSYGKNIEFAIKKSYETVDKISFEGMHFRKDIGFDLIK